MKPLVCSLSFLTGACLLSLTPLASAQTQTVYSSDFNGGTNGASVVGTTLNTSLTGGVWQGGNRIANGGFTYDNTVNGGSIQAAGNGFVAVSLASAGSFTRPANPVFTLSADLSTNNIAYGADASTTRGIGLGFYSSATPTNQDAFSASYHGFVLQISGTAGSATGTLFYVNGVTARTGVTVGTTLTSSTSNFYNLTYTVDTSSGNLTSLVFNGTDFTSSFTAASAGQFTNANTAFAGIGESSSLAGASGHADNFSSVVAVPEPSTYAACVAGLLLFVCASRRVRRAQIS